MVKQVGGNVVVPLDVVLLSVYAFTYRPMCLLGHRSTQPPVFVAAKGR